MNRVILSALLLTVSSLAYSQNKSLGVGTSTPNPNAALHVESPTGNQGAIMPRLSSAQRLAMSSILGAADAGLLLYDNDLKGLYIWDGAAWQSSAKLQFPVVDTLNTIPPDGNALRIVYNSTDVGNFGVAHFENINPNSGFSALFARTTSATNGAADFVVNNPANNNDAIGVNTNALNGRAGAFNLNNPGSFNHALYAQSNGDSTGSAVHGNNIGNGFGVFGRSVGSKFGSSAVYGLHEGTGDAAGAFRINNAGNPYSALYGESNGTGSAIRALQIGNTANPGGHAGYFQVGTATLNSGVGAAVFGAQLGLGRAGQFQINNPLNAENALRGFTDGTGRAGFFTINNPTSTAVAVFSETNGSGPAFNGVNNGTGDGIAGLFSSSQATNTFPALQASTQGTGPGVRVIQNTTSLGGGMDIYMQNTASNAPGFSVDQQGVGAAANFSINNATNAISVINANTNGTGNSGFFAVNNAANSAAGLFSTTNGTGTAIQGQTSTGFAAVYGRREGATNGNAGLFEITDAGNTFPSLQSTTQGSGDAGSFVINNATSSANSINSTTNGSGNAVAAINNGTGFAMYARALGATDAVYAVKQGGDGAGSAGNFQNQEPTNNASALFALTNASGGSALGASNAGNGNAFSIFQGGMKVSTAVLNAGTSTLIDTRAAAYFIEDASSPFTFSGGVAFSEGDMIYIFNGDLVNNAIIDSLVIPTNQGIVGIYMAGALRFFAYTAP